MKKKRISVFLITFLVIGGVLFLLVKPKAQIASPSSSVPSPTTENADKADKVAPKPSEQNKASTGSRVKVNITNLSQDDSTLFVRTVVEGAASGNCLLEIRMSGQDAIIKTAPIILATSYYSCDGFNISKKEIPVKGEWTVAIKTNAQNATEFTQKIMIE